jgi:hypothetical protein
VESSRVDRDSISVNQVSAFQNENNNENASDAIVGNHSLDSEREIPLQQ